MKIIADNHFYEHGINEVQEKCQAHTLQQDAQHKGKVHISKTHQKESRNQVRMTNDTVKLYIIRVNKA